MNSRIIAYDGTYEDQQRIEKEQEAEGYILVEIQNITEGNFLGFVLKDGYVPTTPQPEETKIEKLEKRLEETNAAVNDLTVAMVDFMMGGE